MRKSKFLIVGIDPGITTGLCILDLNGNFIHSESSRELDIKKVVKRISEYGIPILIACDVNRAPKLVEKVAAKFQSKIFTPEDDLSVELKRSLTEGIKVRDDHERDAIASAFLAFRRNKNFFEKVDEELKSLSQEERDLAKKELLLGEVPSIGAYLEKLRNKEKEFGKKGKKRIKESEREKLISSLKGELKFLRIRIRELEEENTKLKELLARIPRISRESGKSSEFIHLQRRIRELTNLVENLRIDLAEREREIEVLKRGYLIVREFEEISEEILKFEGDALLIKRISDLDESFLPILKKFPLIIVNSIDPKSENLLNSNNIPFVLEKNVKLESISGLTCVRKDAIEERKKPKEIVEEIIKEYREKRKNYN